MGGSGDREAREFTGDGVLKREKEESLLITYVKCKGKNVRKDISICTSRKVIRGRNEVKTHTPNSGKSQ
jgi:hypothetical protein